MTPNRQKERPVMSISNKANNLQMFRLMLHGRALHPELFDLQGRRCHRQPEYEFETWVVPGGHIVRFQVDDEMLVETVLEKADHLPETGLVHALPCLGEKEYEMEPQGDIKYVTSIQTETLTDNLYMATFREMCDFATECGGLEHRWDDDSSNPCLSLIDIQKYRRELHLQTYHLIGATGLVLRTQSIFERL